MEDLEYQKKIRGGKMDFGVLYWKVEFFENRKSGVMKPLKVELERGRSASEKDSKET